MWWIVDAFSKWIWMNVGFFFFLNLCFMWVTAGPGVRCWFWPISHLSCFTVYHPRTGYSNRSRCSSTSSSIAGPSQIETPPPTQAQSAPSETRPPPAKQVSWKTLLWTFWILLFESFWPPLSSFFLSSDFPRKQAHVPRTGLPLRRAASQRQFSLWQEFWPRALPEWRGLLRANVAALRQLQRPLPFVHILAPPRPARSKRPSSAASSNTRPLTLEVPSVKSIHPPRAPLPVPPSLNPPTNSFQWRIKFKFTCFSQWSCSAAALHHSTSFRLEKLSHFCNRSLFYSSPFLSRAPREPLLP